MRIKKFLAIVFVAIIAYFGSNTILNKLENNELKKTYGDDFSFDDDAIGSNEHEHLFLLVGVDKNSDDDDNDDFTRTDTIMLVKANTETGKIDILSIPRDSRVKIRQEFDKVNHAHAFGGIELTIQTLRNFLGLDIDYYVQVNYKAVENIIDALGGVDFDVPKGVSIDVGSLKIREGMNHFDGQHALWYLRTRKIYENGDIGRVEAQQGFMKAMVDQIVAKSEKINLTTFVTNYLKYIKTNLPMSVLMDLTNNIGKFSSANVSTFTVPGREQTIEGTSYYLPDFEKTWRLVDKEFQNFKLRNWDRTKAGIDEDGNILDERKNKIEEATEPNPEPAVEAPVREEIIENTETHYYEPEPAPRYEYEYYEPEYVEEEVEEAAPEEAPKEKEESPKETEEKVEKSDTSDKDE